VGPSGRFYEQGLGSPGARPLDGDRCNPSTCVRYRVVSPPKADTSRRPVPGMCEGTEVIAATIMNQGDIGLPQASSLLAEAGSTIEPILSRGRASPWL